MLYSSLSQGTAVSSRRETTTSPMTSHTVLPAHHNLPTCLPLCHCSPSSLLQLCAGAALLGLRQPPRCTSPVLRAPGHLPLACMRAPHCTAVLLKRASWHHLNCRVGASPLKSMSYSTWYMGIFRVVAIKTILYPVQPAHQQDRSSCCYGPSKYTPWW